METLQILAMLRARGLAWVAAGALEEEQHVVLDGFLALLEAALREDVERAFMTGRYGLPEGAAKVSRDSGDPLPGL
uniref:Uncharacterized protein n=1 Tax=uncultured prokaryote TaxID=198431 RepID=A0A0H5Q531_9ZZZZ|nr:hypothetical protein [uncultured prokaryote]